jgi:hypothetical protein
MHDQPAPCDGDLQAGAVFSGRALVAEQEEGVEFLNIDPSILNWFESACMLEEATGGSSVISIRQSPPGCSLPSRLWRT